MSSSPYAAVYDRWFHKADADGDGRVTPKDAVTFFERSKLDRAVLAKVWELANSTRAGYLDRLSFHKAMDLIALGQQGVEITKERYTAMVARGGYRLPVMEGYDEDGEAEYTGEPEAPPPPHEAFGSMRMSPSFPAPATGGHQPGGYDRPSPSSQPAASTSGTFNIGWGKKEKENKRKPVPAKICTSVIDGLKDIYFKKVRPLESEFKFAHFFSPLLNESDFEAKPSVLLLGQYSTGKTTFIKYLLGRDYPGCTIGPEPTTDRFVVVYHGLEERRVPGNTLAVQPDQPYQGLSTFGTGFLARLEGSQCAARLLEEISLVDTPGVLSGEKQRIERNYNFIEIVEWFATRCDLIFLLFDPHKLDISDEFKQVICALKGHDDKVRVILNKADQVDNQQLMRVYGALMWSLGKVFRSPEVCKVYVGSFNSEAPISVEKNPHGKALFDAEQKQLLDDLYDIPQRSADRKINEFVKRIRAFKIHMLIIGHLRKKMPSMFGKEAAQKKLLEDMPAAFLAVQREYHLPRGDFPDPTRFRDILSAFDLLAFPKGLSSQVKVIDNVLSVDIPNLVRQFDNPFP